MNPNALYELMYFQDIRSIPSEKLYTLIQRAMDINMIETIIVIFFIRSVHMGRGERKIGRVCFNFLANTYPKMFLTFFHLIPRYGRWDDLLYITNPYIIFFIDLFIKIQLEQDFLNMTLGKKISLCAKWMPTENHSFHKYNPHRFGILLSNLKMSRKEYRKLLSVLRKYIDIPERKLCLKQPVGKLTIGSRHKYASVLKTTHSFSSPFRDLLTDFKQNRNVEGKWKQVRQNQSKIINKTIYSFVQDTEPNRLQTHLSLAVRFNTFSFPSFEAMYNEIYNVSTKDLFLLLESFLIRNKIPDSVLMITTKPFHIDYDCLNRSRKQYESFQVSFPNIIVWNPDITDINITDFEHCLYITGLNFSLIELILSTDVYAIAPHLLQHSYFADLVQLIDLKD